LWHQHQPMYKNPVTNSYELPWVRLHAIKDYYDMVAILDDFPKIKLNINLVPSLIVQLEDYASGKAKDKFVDMTLKDASQLSQDDKIFILMNFFMANWENMIAPNNRYLQLLEKRGRHTSETEVKSCLAFFKDEDFRDLQVWFNLAWFDPYWIRTDDFIKGLYNKGRDFTEEDKHLLIQKQFEICGKIVQKHKEAQDRGQIEVTVSPFYHPILPLLCDTNSALEATPHMQLPKERFSYPQDADKQISDAAAYYEKCFGQKPKGMWPSEGSVSAQAASIISKNGISWIATDEAVLFNSKKDISGDRRMLFRPYSVGQNSDGRQMNIIFRDHGLSDAIGFVYSKWNAEDAANDFISKLYDIRNYMGDSYEAPLVSVILDGENCWEYYKNDGWDFLSALYKKISDSPDIETVRVSDYLEKFPSQTSIENLTAGSWINGNFYIWIGNKETNASWDALSAARDFLISFLEKNPNLKNSKEEKEARDVLMTAQGSDWNWWYCPDHNSESNAVFDYIYRHLLIKIYQIFGQKAPDNLYVAIKDMLKNADQNSFRIPSSFITPLIDGKILNDWNGAGYYKVGHEGGSMHQVSTALRAFYYGNDDKNLYVTLELNSDIAPKIIKDLSFHIDFINPVSQSVVVEFDSDTNLSKFMLEDSSGEKEINGGRACYKEDLEISIPLECLGNSFNYREAEFKISVYKNGFEIEKWPYVNSLRLSNG
jgi:alpha-amylase/alpha-mannosidase (GH57 family)/DNA-dependent RNA polymerase auxiliary subunit epsilon